MKKIEAIIRPEKLDDVRHALEGSGYPGLMITEIIGHGRQRGVAQQWRGEQYRMDLLPKVKLELVVADKDADRIVKTIMDNAATGSVGDGKIFVSDVGQAIRIRTGEKGEPAL
jgi:nitrogen regulatory protein P-II 1